MLQWCHIRTRLEADDLLGRSSSAAAGDVPKFVDLAKTNPTHQTRAGGIITYTKILRAAIGGAVAIVVANVVSNILFENELQSAKVIAVLFEMDPLPLMFTNGLLYMAIAAVIGIVHGLIFFWIEPALPNGIIRRGASFAVILWALMALYFEFHAPFNMFGEPPVLVAVELAFWVAVTLTQALVLSVIYGKGRRELASAVE